MKMIMACLLCVIESQKEEKPPQLLLVELQDNGLYKVTCPKGHETITVLQEQKFELLFDVGVTAIVDGYYRESISAFSASLETFYEFCFKVFALRAGVSDKEFEKAFKNIGNLSERQFGAFVSAFVLTQKQAPPVLHQEQINFRNKVIHRGKFPSKDEAIEFGSEVLLILNGLLFQLKRDYTAEVQKVVSAYTSGVRKQIKPGTQQTGQIHYPTIVSVARWEEGEPRVNFLEELSILEERYNALKKLAGG